MLQVRRFANIGAVLAGYLLVAAWATRPLFAHFYNSSLVDFQLSSYDIPFNAWILSWGSHALARQPLHFFAANIYHPAPNSLAYTEHMLGSLPFFAPAYWATGNPAFALNVMILAGLVLSAAGTYLVVLRWTGSHAAAAFAGLLFGFYPSHVRALGPNLQTMQYFPFILLFLDMVLGGAGWKATLGLAIALLGQCLASYYYAYPAVLATGAAALAACLPRRGRPSLVALARVALAIGLTGIAMVLLSRPYWAVMARGLHSYYDQDRWRQYVPITGYDFFTAIAVPFGVAPVVLGVIAIATGLRRVASEDTHRRVWVLLAWIIVGHLLFAGPTLSLGGYQIPMPSRFLAEYLPGFAALRDRRRLFVVVSAALSVLAGMGIGGVATMWRSQRAQAIVAAVLAVAATGLFAASIDLGPCRLVELPTGNSVPAIYRDLPADGPGPILELPIGATDSDWAAVNLQTEYEYFSTFHWRPMLNGYASYWGSEFEVSMAMARALPAPRALANLVACTNLKWIIVHTGRMGGMERQLWSGPLPGLTLSRVFGQDRLYAVTLAPQADRSCGAGLYGAATNVTLEGTPLEPLPAGDRRAAIELLGLGPEIRRPRIPVAAQGLIRIRNTGSRAWPAVAAGDTALVKLSYRWLDANGKPLPRARQPISTRLPADLLPGEDVTLPLAFRLPDFPGSYRFQVLLDQGPNAPFELSGPGADPVPILYR